MLNAPDGYIETALYEHKNCTDIESWEKTEGKLYMMHILRHAQVIQTHMVVPVRTWAARNLKLMMLAGCLDIEKEVIFEHGNSTLTSVLLAFYHAEYTLTRKNVLQCTHMHY